MMNQLAIIRTMTEALTFSMDSYLNDTAMDSSSWPTLSEGCSDTWEIEVIPTVIDLCVHLPLSVGS